MFQLQIDQYLSQLFKHSDKINGAQYLIEITPSRFVALMVLFKT